MKRILRYSIRIDDKPHEVPQGVPVLFDRSSTNRIPGLEDVVDAWFQVHVPGVDWSPAVYEPPMQRVQIVGTGQAVPDAWQWLASFRDGPLVWHLYAVRGEPQ